VTFLFTDITGCTWQWEQHPEVLRNALTRHDALRRAERVYQVVLAGLPASFP
jgi:hypothetical protein